MEPRNTNNPMLELMLRPAFCVVDGKITQLNQAAEAFLLAENTEVLPLLSTGAEEYADFHSGCLYLTLSLCGHKTGATVLAMDGYHLFLLDQTSQQSELQTLALAARELRTPLFGMMNTANHALASTDPEQSAQFHRRLHQVMRIVSNMSDALSYCQCDTPPGEYLEVCGFFDELLSKAGALLQSRGIHLEYTLPGEALYTLTDSEKLERAMYNLLSNAAKHTLDGGTISVHISKRNRLYISVTDSGTGLNTGVRTNVYARYLRTPSLADGPEGIGLGMVLVRATASLHGGTVLIDQPESGGTRVTMTLEIRHRKTTQLRSPILHIDYAGERDHGLQELADVLPASMYRPDCFD